MHGNGWLVVHDLHDTGAAALADALGAQAVSVTVLMASARWQLQLDHHGSRCALHLGGRQLQPRGVVKDAA